MTTRPIGGSLPGGEVNRSPSEDEESAAPSPPEESVPSVAAGGLQLLGSADAVACEGDVCWVPPTDA
ncbi:MAG: hypothetical protein Q4P32_12000 [Micrococcales bacterium]|nr:hypothetical protein [Micrococcales bacterium]